MTDQGEGQKLLTPEQIESAVAAWGSPIWGDKPPKGDNATIQRLTVTLAAYAEVVRKVAEKRPQHCQSGAYQCPECRCIGWKVDEWDEESEWADPIDHAPDCLYLEARRLRGLA